jgi:hypothetical protein
VPRLFGMVAGPFRHAAGEGGYRFQRSRPELPL